MRIVNSLLPRLNAATASSASAYTPSAILLNSPGPSASPPRSNVAQLLDFGSLRLSDAAVHLLSEWLGASSIASCVPDCAVPCEASGDTEQAGGIGCSG